MTALPPPSRDPLLPGSNRARPTAAAGQPLPPPGSKPTTAASAAPRPTASTTDARLAALQERRRPTAGRPGGGPARTAGPAGRADRSPVKAATVARWRRTWRSRLVATAGAAAGLVGGTVVISHSVHAGTATADTQTASETDTFEDGTTVPAPTAAPVVTAAPTVGTLPPTSAVTATTATTAPTAAAPATAATAATAPATVPAVQAPATSRATTATTARPRTTTPARTRQQQPASRSSGS